MIRVSSAGVGRIALLCLVLSAFPNGVWGQEARDTVQLDDLVATATRVPLSLESLTSAVTVISGEELQARGIRFVSEVLRDLPGATVVPVGSFGGVTSLFLRGGESDYVKVLVDGAAINLPGGSFNFANLTTDNVDRIEIVRGPASVLYGSDAVTGVVQLFTKHGRDGVTVEASGTGGTFGSRTFGASVSGGHGDGRLGYALSASRFSTDGTAAFNNDYANTAVSGTVRAALDQQTTASLSLRYNDNTFHFPTDASGVASDSNQFTFDESLALSLGLGSRLSPRVEATLLFTRYDIDGGFDDRQDHPGDTLGFAFASRRSFNILRQSLDARLNVRALPSTMITTGAVLDLDREQQNGEASSNFGGGPEVTRFAPFDEDRRNLGYYVQALVDLPLPASLHLGARLDDNDAFGSFFTYRAGAVYRVSPDLRVRASIGTGFKAPTFAENFADAPFEVGNPDLDPERSISWEVGAEHTMWSGRLAVWANYFDQRFRDLVQYVFSEPGLPNYHNLPQALARGIETGVSLVPRAGMTVTGQYTYLDTETIDPGANSSPGTAFELGKPLLRRPAHTLRVAGSIRLAGRSTLGVNLNHVGARDDLAFEGFTAARVKLPAYSTLEVSGMVDVLASRPGRPGVTVTLRVENALDEEYDTVAGFQGRGRVVSLGARVRF